MRRRGSLANGRALSLVGCLSLLLLPGPLHAAPPKIDKKGVQALAKDWFAARPKTQFENWDRAKRDALLKRAEALGPLPEGGRDAVVDACWKAIKKNAPKLKKGELDTPYGKARVYPSGSGGKKNGLVLSLHGGGEGAGSSDASWTLPKTMKMAPTAVVLDGDAWNTVHGERYLLTMIEIAKARYEIDPDRVFVAGFSMGGTGSWFFAGRHPDLLAGAIPAHGVLMAEKPQEADPDRVGLMQYGLVPNVRNLAVYFYTGSVDGNCEPGTFIKAWQQVEELKKTDPGGYELVRFTCHEGVAHSQPPGEPSGAYKFMKGQVRNAFPETLVWEYAEYMEPLAKPRDKVTRRVKRWFYWLHCKVPVDQMQVRAVRSKGEDTNIIDIEVAGAMAEDFTIWLNDRMIDPSLDVVVNLDGKEVYRGKPQPSYACVFDSLDARLDRTMVFDRKITLPEAE